jgi:hypothetical protein
MKSIILSATALALGLVATAQTPQTVTAPAQQPSPTAAALIGGNYSNIDQIAVGSSAMVQQQGTANASFIEQTGSNAANLNTVDVLQWGNVQPSISGHLNYSDITQNGEGNDYMVTQQGDLNENFGTQVGVNNSVLVQQGANGVEQAESNLAIADQDGRENSAEIQQRYDNSKATILQRNDAVSGVGNKSYQEQVANPNASAGHTAIGTQYGDGNELIQMQEGPGAGNYAEANQGDAATAANGAFAQQLQSGELNEAYVDQYLTDDTSYQEQDGTSNKAVAKQNVIGSSLGGNNYIEQFQQGTSNEAIAEQAGRNNMSYQEQYGSDNYSNTFQAHGQINGNNALVIQNGTMNSSEIAQRANGNTATVDQLGNGHMSVINQNNPLGGFPAVSSGSNSATVIQRNANVSLTPQTQRVAASKAHTF